MTRPLSERVKRILLRMVAVVVVEITGVVGVGSVVGVDAWTSAAIAAALGVITVTRSIALAYLQDGEITDAEIEEAFAEVRKEGEK